MAITDPNRLTQPDPTHDHDPLTQLTTYMGRIWVNKCCPTGGSGWVWVWQADP